MPDRTIGTGDMIQPSARSTVSVRNCMIYKTTVSCGYDPGHADITEIADPDLSGFISKAQEESR